jgi:hypothetical protein
MDESKLNKNVLGVSKNNINHRKKLMFCVLKHDYDVRIFLKKEIYITFSGSQSMLCMQ